MIYVKNVITVVLIVSVSITVKAVAIQTTVKAN